MNELIIRKMNPLAGPVTSVKSNRHSCGVMSNESGWPRGFCERNPSPPSWIVTSVSVESSPRYYLLTSATVRVPVHTAPKYGTKTIRYVTLHYNRRRMRNFAPLQKSRRNHRSYVWTDAPSGMVFAQAQKLFGIHAPTRSGSQRAIISIGNNLRNEISYL